MRRLLLLAVLVPACSWLLWASCSDDYRDTLPFRSYDAAPHEGGPPSSPPDLTVVADLAKTDQGQADLPKSDAGTMDAGKSDAGGSDAGGSDAGSGSDGGHSDGGSSDGGSGD